MRSSSYYTDTDTSVSARCAECREAFTRKASEGWRQRCFRCFKAGLERDAFQRGFASGQEAAKLFAAPAIEPGRLRQLLQLAHPDKHDGSALATEVTQWLLELRREAKR